LIAVVLAAQVAFAQSRPAKPTPSDFTLTTLRSQCLLFSEVKPSDFLECHVTEFKEFGMVDKQTYYYALYCLMPNYAGNKETCRDSRYHQQRGLAVFVGSRGGTTARLLFERATRDIGTLYYQPPQIIRVGKDTVLHLAIAVDGTGHFNQSEYFLRNNGTWAPMETQRWRNDVGRRVPPGLGIWKGVWPDLDTMTAVANLYKPKDANCCPSGGSLRIKLAIRSHGFVATSIVFEKP
jgi:hypothetical protein